MILYDKSKNSSNRISKKPKLVGAKKVNNFRYLQKFIYLWCFSCCKSGLLIILWTTVQGQKIRYRKLPAVFKNCVTFVSMQLQLNFFLLMYRNEIGERSNSNNLFIFNNNMCWNIAVKKTIRTQEKVYIIISFEFWNFKDVRS